MRTFEPHYSKLGALACRILAVARERHATSRPLTVERVGELLASFFKYLAVERGFDDASELTAADINEFLDRHTGTSRYVHLSTLRPIIRRACPSVILRNAEDSGTSSVVPALTADATNAIVAAAKRDIERYWAEFCLARSPDAPKLMRTVREHAAANGGVLPPLDRATHYEFTKLYWREQYHSAKRGEHDHGKTWHRWLYATVESLLPYMILITYRLAGNVQSVLEISRDALQAASDPILSDRYEVRFTKHRARKELVYGVRDRGGFSLPALLRQVAAMSEPLLERLPVAAQRERLFIGMVSTGITARICRALVRSDVSARSIQRFVAHHGLVDPLGRPLFFTLQQLRPTRAVEDFLKHGDVFRTQALLNKASSDGTVAYLNQLAVLKQGEEVIADMQGALQAAAQRYTDGPTAEGAAVPAGEVVRTPERDCIDPAAPPHRKRDGKLCRNFLWPLNAPELVIPHEPEYLAELIRDRRALEQARVELLPDRFERYYSERLDLINDLIAQFEPDLHARAELIANGLPAPMELS